MNQSAKYTTVISGNFPDTPPNEHLTFTPVPVKKRTAAINMKLPVNETTRKTKPGDTLTFRHDDGEASLYTIFWVRSIGDFIFINAIGTAEANQ